MQALQDSSQIDRIHIDEPSALRANQLATQEESEFCKSVLILPSPTIVFKALSLAYTRDTCYTGSDPRLPTSDNSSPPGSY